MYCGKNPRDHKVTLEVDHKISVKDWWGKEEENLVTSCFDCNRGKRGDSHVFWTELEEKTFELKKVEERLEQIQYISKLKTSIKKKEREIEDEKISFVYVIMWDYKEDFIEKMAFRIKNQHKKFGYDLELLEECLQITDRKFSKQKEFYRDDYMKYFHGVLNTKIQWNDY